jgi:hypothetical protein
MRFKNKADERIFFAPPPEIDRCAYKALREFLSWVEERSLEAGEGELTITSFYRPTDPNLESYHRIGQAVDIRCHKDDKSDRWYEAMMMLGQSLFRFDSKLRVWWHPELRGTPQEHIHIGYHDGVL